MENMVQSPRSTSKSRKSMKSGRLETKNLRVEMIKAPSTESRAKTMATASSESYSTVDMKKQRSRYFDAVKKRQRKKGEPMTEEDESGYLQYNYATATAKGGSQFPRTVQQRCQMRRRVFNRLVGIISVCAILLVLVVGVTMIAVVARLGRMENAVSTMEMGDDD